MHHQRLPLEGKLSAGRLTDEVSKDTDCRVASLLAMTGLKALSSIILWILLGQNPMFVMTEDKMFPPAIEIYLVV